MEELGDEPKEADESKEEGEQKRKRESDDIYDTSRWKTWGEIAREYYETHSTGSCMAGVMYELAVQLNKANKIFFWYWVLGLTDQYMHGRISTDTYQDQILELGHAYTNVFRAAFINAQDVHDEPENADQNTPQDEEVKMDYKTLFFKQVQTESENKDPGHVFQSTYEMKLMLMREWSFENSIKYSNYVAPRFKTWGERGLKHMMEFFASIGIPLSQCRESYKFMKPALKENLINQIQQHKERYHLNDIFYSSFLWQVDPKTKISASSMVYAITSLIESPTDVNWNFNPEEQNDEDSDEEVMNQVEKWASIATKNFWYAYDCLNDNAKAEQIEVGIEIAKKTQIAIMDQAASIIMSKKVQ